MPSNINKASEPRLQSLEEVIKTIREFLVPVVEAVYQNADFQKMWDPDRGWIWLWEWHFMKIKSNPLTFVHRGSDSMFFLRVISRFSFYWSPLWHPKPSPLHFYTRLRIKQQKPVLLLEWVCEALLLPTDYLTSTSRYRHTQANFIPIEYVWDRGMVEESRWRRRLTNRDDMNSSILPSFTYLVWCSWCTAHENWPISH